MAEEKPKIAPRVRNRSSKSASVPTARTPCPNLAAIPQFTQTIVALSDLLGQTSSSSQDAATGRSICTKTFPLATNLHTVISETTGQPTLFTHGTVASSVPSVLATKGGSGLLNFPGRLLGGGGSGGGGVMPNLPLGSVIQLTQIAPPLSSSNNSNNSSSCTGGAQFLAKNVTKVTSTITSSISSSRDVASKLQHPHSINSILSKASTSSGRSRSHKSKSIRNRDRSGHRSSSSSSLSTTNRHQITHTVSSSSTTTSANPSESPQTSSSSSNKPKTITTILPNNANLLNLTASNKSVHLPTFMQTISSSMLGQIRLPSNLVYTTSSGRATSMPVINTSGASTTITGVPVTIANAGGGAGGGRGANSTASPLQCSFFNDKNGQQIAVLWAPNSKQPRTPGQMSFIPITAINTSNLPVASDGEVIQPIPSTVMIQSNHPLNMAPTSAAILPCPSTNTSNNVQQQVSSTITNISQKSSILMMNPQQNQHQINHQRQQQSSASIVTTSSNVVVANRSSVTLTSNSNKPNSNSIIRQLLQSSAKVDTNIAQDQAVLAQLRKRRSQILVEVSTQTDPNSESVMTSMVTSPQPLTSDKFNIMLTPVSQSDMSDDNDVGPMSTMDLCGGDQGDGDVKDSESLSAEVSDAAASNNNTQIHAASSSSSSRLMAALTNPNSCFLSPESTDSTKDETLLINHMMNSAQSSSFSHLQSTVGTFKQEIEDDHSELIVNHHSQVLNTTQLMQIEQSSSLHKALTAPIGQHLSTDYGESSQIEDPQLTQDLQITQYLDSIANNSIANNISTITTTDTSNMNIFTSNDHEIKNDNDDENEANDDAALLNLLQNQQFKSEISTTLTDAQFAAYLHEQTKGDQLIDLQIQLQDQGLSSQLSVITTNSANNIHYSPYLNEDVKVEEEVVPMSQEANQSTHLSIMANGQYSVYLNEVQQQEQQQLQEVDTFDDQLLLEQQQQQLIIQQLNTSSNTTHPPSIYLNGDIENHINMTSQSQVGLFNTQNVSSSSAFVEDGGDEDEILCNSQVEQSKQLSSSLGCNELKSLYLDNDDNNSMDFMPEPSSSLAQVPNNFSNITVSSTCSSSVFLNEGFKDDTLTNIHMQQQQQQQQQQQLIQSHQSDSLFGPMILEQSSTSYFNEVIPPNDSALFDSQASSILDPNLLLTASAQDLLSLANLNDGEPLEQLKSSLLPDLNMSMDLNDELESLQLFQEQPQGGFFPTLTTPTYSVSLPACSNNVDGGGGGPLLISSMSTTSEAYYYHQSGQSVPNTTIVEFQKEDQFAEALFDVANNQEIINQIASTSSSLTPTDIIPSSDSSLTLPLDSSTNTTNSMQSNSDSSSDSLIIIIDDKPPTTISISELNISNDSTESYDNQIKEILVKMLRNMGIDVNAADFPVTNLALVKRIMVKTTSGSPPREPIQPTDQVIIIHPTTESFRLATEQFGGGQSAALKRPLEMANLDSLLGANIETSTDDASTKAKPKKSRSIAKVTKSPSIPALSMAILGAIETTTKSLANSETDTTPTTTLNGMLMSPSSSGTSSLITNPFSGLGGTDSVQSNSVPSMTNLLSSTTCTSTSSLSPVSLSNSASSNQNSLLKSMLTAPSMFDTLGIDGVGGGGGGDMMSFQHTLASINAALPDVTITPVIAKPKPKRVRNRKKVVATSGDVTISVIGTGGELEMSVKQTPPKKAPRIRKPRIRKKPEPKVEPQPNTTSNAEDGAATTPVAALVVAKKTKTTPTPKAQAKTQTPRSRSKVSKSATKVQITEPQSELMEQATSSSDATVIVTPPDSGEEPKAKPKPKPRVRKPLTKPPSRPRSRSKNIPTVSSSTNSVSNTTASGSLTTSILTTPPITAVDGVVRHHMLNGLLVPSPLKMPPKASAAKKRKLPIR